VPIRSGQFNPLAVAEVLESQFSDIAENQPELLARHCTEAGQIEKALGRSPTLSTQSSMGARSVRPHR
jgi:hypothetical protein